MIRLKTIREMTCAALFPAALILQFFSTNSPAQPARSSTTVFDVLNQYRQSNQYLAAYRALEAFPERDQQTHWLKLQLQLTYASFLSGHPAYDSLLAQFERPPKPDSLFRVLERSALRGDSVYRQLLEAAGKHRVVMINENHFMPWHRLLVSRLLPRLRRMGFRYLAVEALFSDTLINQPDGYPTVFNGFYVKEPIFGRLLRQARRLGFVLVPYDVRQQGGDREVRQAENLFQRTFQKDSTARVVVLAGIAHVFEKPTPGGKKWMAGIFRDRFGIDPLTVDQTSLSRYRFLLHDSLALLPAREVPDSSLQRADFLLVNGLSWQDSAPDGGNFQFTNSFDQPVQLNVFLKQEVVKAGGFERLIPFRAVYLAPGASIALQLPDSAFQLVVYGPEGEVKLSRTVRPNVPQAGQ
ncbi:MAG: hypothetical protein D6715_08420 [Calditrichaeota bacterium]|nr:MAG: hypothetical protein D6715_08420 [Calditrichota bacterium]